MSCMSSRESMSSVISTTHDGNSRQTFRQDCNGLSYRFHRIQQGKQAYPDHHRLINRLARSNTNPEQVCRHNHQGIRNYLPRHMCPRFILSDNGTEFKNQIFDKVTKDLGIERIFSAPYHPQSNGKLETFHKFLKPTLKKMCAEDQDNWDEYIKQVLGTYRGVPNLMTGESPFFLVYGRDGNQPVHWIQDYYASTNIDFHCP